MTAKETATRLRHMAGVLEQLPGDTDVMDARVTECYGDEILFGGAALPELAADNGWELEAEPSSSGDAVFRSISRGGVRFIHVDLQGGTKNDE